MTLIKDKEGILFPWQEQFSELMNRDSHVEPDNLDNVAAALIRAELDDVIHIKGSFYIAQY